VREEVERGCRAMGDAVTDRGQPPPK
jgi:hypothetical protein